MPPALGIDDFVQRFKLLPSGCLEWQAGRGRHGHAYFKGRDYAYRYIYKFHYGPIPVGLQIHHACGNSTCVNPDHLQALTQKAHRALHVAQRTHCSWGHEYTPENTRWIREGRSRLCLTCRKTYRQWRTEREQEKRRAVRG